MNSYIVNNSALGTALHTNRNFITPDTTVYPVGSGGGISNSIGGSIELDHTAILQNRSYRGAGIANGLPASLIEGAISGGNFQIRDTVFENNVRELPVLMHTRSPKSRTVYEEGDFRGPDPASCLGTFTSVGHNLYADTTCPTVESDILDSSQVFINEQRINFYGVPYFPLYEYSHAIDQGSFDSTVSNDIRNTRRPVGSAPDIGPYEWNNVQIAQPQTTIPTILPICFGSSTDNDAVNRCCQKLGYYWGEPLECCLEVLKTHSDLRSVTPSDLREANCKIESFIYKRPIEVPEIIPEWKNDINKNLK